MFPYYGFVIHVGYFNYISSFFPSLLIFAYAGLTLAADLGEEARNPVRTISWGIIISVALLVYQGPKALLYSANWLAIGSVFYLLGYRSKKEEIDSLISEWPRDRCLS